MKVYYNESCSICRAEINLYKKQNIEEIDWVDITNNINVKNETLKNDKQLLRRLHVKKNGKIFSGAEAFLLVWKKIPKYKFLYNLFKLPIIFQIFSIGYEIIAFFLYLKNRNQIKTN
jgi:predicted DCC family thiol-disulfide oxidoreductase YuxK